MPVKFCSDGGAGLCSACGAPCKGLVQNCPSPKRYGVSAQVAMRGPRGFGTFIAECLAAVGYTRERHNAVRRWLHLTTPCGCSEREAWLNTLDRWDALAWCSALGLLALALILRW